LCWLKRHSHAKQPRPRVHTRSSQCAYMCEQKLFSYKARDSEVVFGSLLRFGAFDPFSSASCRLRHEALEKGSKGVGGAEICVW